MAVLTGKLANKQDTTIEMKGIWIKMELFDLIMNPDIDYTAVLYTEHIKIFEVFSKFWVCRVSIKDEFVSKLQSKKLENC